MQNFSQFFTTFDFDREYLQNGSTYQKLEKLLIIYNPSHVRRKNLAYFGPQTKKLLTLINVHPNRIFSGNYISAHRGCCAMKFLYALEIDQGNLAHTPSGTGVPPKNFNRENLKSGLKFSVLKSITSGLRTRLFLVDVPRGSGDKKCTIFTMPAPKNLRRQKIVNNFSRFLTTFVFDREYLRK